MITPFLEDEKLKGGFQNFYWFNWIFGVRLVCACGIDIHIQEMKNSISVLAAYDAAPVLQRALVWARPAICPFDVLMAQVPEGSRVLDVGCGTGMFLVSLAVEGRISSGLGRDINAPAIEAAQSAARHFDCLVFERARDEQDWPSEQFDVVSAIDVIHHIPPTYQEQFLDKLYACVKPGGRLIYKDMADRPVFHASVNRLHDLVLARQWIHYFPLEQARAWGEKQGLRVLAEKNYKALAYAHEMIVWEKP